MSTLTDRYVWGVLRAVPAAQRAELGPEIRALVADAVEARVAAGVVPAEAERAAVMELGDPERLAAQYTDKALSLIGPRYFPDWRRLLQLLLSIVVPIVAVAVMGAGILAETPIAEVVANGLGSAFMVGVQIAFWVTLAFAIMERREIPDLDEELAWTPDRLPETPAEAVRPSLVEVGFSVAALVVAIGALIWQQAAAPIAIDGVGHPLFDPALWSFWIPWFLVLLVLEIVFTWVRWLRGGWTWTLAVVNVVLNLAFVIPAVWLVQTGTLLDPGLVTAIDAKVGSAWLQPTISIGMVIAVAISAWDAFDGFRQAWLRSREAA